MRGDLVLCNTDPIKTTGVTLCLRGREHVKLTYIAVSGAETAEAKHDFFRHDWSFAGQQTLPAGNHSWRFELSIPGEVRESIEGMRDNWVVWQLRATVGRTRLYRDAIAHKHLYIIRTFDMASSELAQPIAVNNTWPEKVNYDISTPTRGVIFGSSMPVKFQMTPLKKGLRLDRIAMHLREHLHLQVRMASAPNREHEENYEIVGDEYKVPLDHPLEEAEDGSEAWLIQRTLVLPADFLRYRQTVEGAHIQISHTVRFAVSIVNPDGHVSEVRGNIPIHIFIPPDLRISAANDITTPSRRALADEYADGQRIAPPDYNTHHLDPLFSGIDPTQYITPAASTPATPIETLSRSGSHEDVANMATTLPRDLSATSLNSRLASIHDTSTATAGSGARRTPYRNSSVQSFSTTTDLRRGHASATDMTEMLRRRASGQIPYNRPPYFPSSTSSGGNHVRRASHSPAATGPTDSDAFGLTMRGPPARLRPRLPGPPLHIDLSPESLSKVPSYQTAMHTPARVANCDDLPTYETAVSRPASPPPPARASPPTHGALGRQPSPPSAGVSPTARTPPAAMPPPARRISPSGTEGEPERRPRRHVRYASGTAGGDA